MVVPKSLPLPSDLDDKSNRHNDDFSSDSSTSRSEATLSVVHPLFSLGGLFGKGPGQQSYASECTNSDDGSLHDGECSIPDNSTVGNTTAYTSVFGGESMEETAAQSVIISLSYAGSDSELTTDDIEKEPRSCDGRSSLAKKGHKKSNRFKKSRGKKMIKTITHMLEGSTGIDTESRDADNVTGSATERTMRETEDSENTIADSQQTSLKNINSSPIRKSIATKATKEHTGDSCSPSTTCADTVISTSSQARAFMEQDDATFKIFRAEEMANSLSKGHWLGFTWLTGSTINDDTNNGKSTQLVKTSVSTTERHGEDQLVEVSTRLFPIEESCVAKELQEPSKEDSTNEGDIPVSTCEPIPLKSPCNLNECTKSRLGLRGLFLRKKAKTPIGHTCPDPKDLTSEKVNVQDRSLPAYEERQDEQGNGSDQNKRKTSVELLNDELEREPSPVAATPLKGEKVTPMIQVLPKQATDRKPTSIQAKAVIPPSLPIPREATKEKSIRSKKVLDKKKATEMPVEQLSTKQNMEQTEGNVKQVPSKVPSALLKALSNITKREANPHERQTKLNRRWGRGSVRQAKITQPMTEENHQLLGGLGLPTIEEGAKDFSARSTHPQTKAASNESSVKKECSISSNNAESRKNMGSGTVMQVQAANSSMSHYSGKSSGSKISKSSKVSQTSGHSEETIQRKNRNLLSRLLRNRASLDVSRDGGELRDMITQYKEKRSIAGQDGTKSVSFDMENRKKTTGFSSLADERRVLRAMNLAVSKRLRAIEELQEVEKGNLCGSTLCFCY